MDVYKELDKACKKAQKNGLNIKPKHFGLVIRGGKFSVRTKNVCLIGAFLLEKKPLLPFDYAEPTLFEWSCHTASKELGITYDQVSDIIGAFDNPIWYDNKWSKIGKQLREKYVGK